MANMLAWTALAAAALLSTGGAALAQDAARPADRIGRFTMIPAEEGFVRLDTETGVVSHCRRMPADAEGAEAGSGPWRCVVVEDDGRRAPAPESSELDGMIAGEIASLAQKVARLSARLDALEKPAAEPRETPAPRVEERDREEMDRALDFTEELMRRFFGMVRELKRETEEGST